MCKRIFALLLCLLTLVSLAACDSSEGVVDTTVALQDTKLPAETDVVTTDVVNTDVVTTEAATTEAETTAVVHAGEVALPEYTVLFIGNSYTYYNDMHIIFRNLVKSAGGIVTVAKVTNGGHTLGEFASDADTYGKQVSGVIKKNYDYIFLQEQSLRPATTPKIFDKGVRELCKKIAPYGSKVILYETWGRKAGHADLAKYGWTTADMEAKLNEAYTAIAKELGLTVSYAGAAMLDVYTNHPEIELYNSDKHHPSPQGSYLAACVHFATLYGVSPVGIEFTNGLDQKTAGILQEAAERVWLSSSIG